MCLNFNTGWINFVRVSRTLIGGPPSGSFQPKETFNGGFGYEIRHILASVGQKFYWL
jgi:hypothetical protein